MITIRNGTRSVIFRNVTLRLLVGASASAILVQSATAGSVCLSETDFNNLKTATTAFNTTNPQIVAVPGQSNAFRLVAPLFRTPAACSGPAPDPALNCSDTNLQVNQRVNSVSDIASSTVNLTFRTLGSQTSSTSLTNSQSGSIASGGVESPGGVSGGSAGPPVLAGVDISGRQAEELLRQRREFAQQQTTAPAAVATAAPAQTLEPATVTTTTQSGAPVSSATPAARRSRPQPATSSPATSSQGTVAQSAAVSQSTQSSGADNYSSSASRGAVTYGAWSQIYGDHERHRNLAPGAVDNTTRQQNSFGQIGGLDATIRIAGSIPQAIQLGVLAGHHDSRSKFSDTPNVTNAHQRNEGAIVGGYLNYQFGRLALETLFKADLFEHTQRAVVQSVQTTNVSEKVVTNTLSCTDPAKPFLLLDTATPVQTEDRTRASSFQTVVNQFRSGQISENNYSIGTNVSYRFALGGRSWFEPVAGVRYTYTDFDTGASSLNLRDGEVLRVQGGVRLGTSWLVGGGYTFSASVLGMLYSDVYVSGFTITDQGFVSTVSNVDEGKLRALGQIATRLDGWGGLSYTAQLDVRGGQDVIGVGGRLGVRWEW